MVENARCPLVYYICSEDCQQAGFLYGAVTCFFWSVVKCHFYEIWLGGISVWMEGLSALWDVPTLSAEGVLRTVEGPVWGLFVLHAPLLARSIREKITTADTGSALNVDLWLVVGVGSDRSIRPGFCPGLAVAACCCTRSAPTNCLKTQANQTWRVKPSLSHYICL